MKASSFPAIVALVAAVLSPAAFAAVTQNDIPFSDAALFLEPSGAPTPSDPFTDYTTPFDPEAPPRDNCMNIASSVELLLTTETNNNKNAKVMYEMLDVPPEGFPFELFPRFTWPNQSVRSLDADDRQPTDAATVRTDNDDMVLGCAIHVDNDQFIRRQIMQWAMRKMQAKMGYKMVFQSPATRWIVRRSKQSFTVLVRFMPSYTDKF